MTQPQDVKDPAELMDLDPDQITMSPEIVKKRPHESATQFIERCERTGVGRQCHHCGKKRRMAMVQCPFCGMLAFRQVDRIFPQEPVEGEPPEDDRDRLNPQANQGYQFAPNPDFDPEAGKQDIKQISKNLQEYAPLVPGSSLESMTVAQLKNLANVREIDIGKATLKADIIDAIQQSIGDFDVKPPPDAPTKVLDQEGLDASKNQLPNPNETEDGDED